MVFIEIPLSPPTSTTSAIVAGISTALDTLQTVASGNQTPSIHQQVKLLVLVPLTITIVSCNILVLIFLLIHPKLHRPTYFFVGSLTVADLFVGCMSMWTIEREDDLRFTLCLIRMCVLTSSIVASLYFMVWIALDRYLAITAALTYEQKMTKCRAILAIVLSWTVALSIGFAPLMGWELDKSTDYCSFCYIDSTGYQLFLFGVGFILPMTVTIVVYIILFRNARCHIKRMEIAEQITYPERRSQRRGLRNRWNSRNWKSMKTLLLMISCFVLTWSPFILASIVQMICGDVCNMKDIIGTYLMLLGFCNSFINPIIYAVSNREFKATLSKSWALFRKRILCRRRLN